jgi:outer membrane lipoprotein-sorting protein
LLTLNIIFKAFAVMKRFFLFTAMSLLFCMSNLPSAHAEKAQALVEDAVNYLRGENSRAVVTMSIQRPDWQRTMTIKVWTQAMEDSIFWITTPPRDRGNGTLKRGNEMWIYNPKVNRVIKLPPSMMSQSWQGSDFSNNDLAKSDSIVDQYTHEIISTETHQHGNPSGQSRLRHPFASQAGRACGLGHAKAQNPRRSHPAPPGLFRRGQETGQGPDHGED